jgi:chitodextrinase
MKTKGAVMTVIAWLAGAGSPGLAGPANDHFADHIPLTGTRVTLTATNTGATREPGEPNAGDFQEASILQTVWWSWVAPAEGVLGVSTLGSDFYAALDVHTGTALENLQSVSGCAPGSYGCMVSLFPVTAGTTYYIVVGSPSDNTGNILLNLAFIGRPPNDNFADRIPLGSDNVAVTGTNTAATTEPGETQTVFPMVGRTLWWSWLAPTDGLVTISVEAIPTGSEGQIFPTEQGTTIWVSVSMGDNLNTLVMVTNRGAYAWGHAPPLIQVTFNAVAVTRYQIAADGAVGLFATLKLNIARTRPPLVILSHPLNNAEFLAGDPVVATAEAFDPDGTVRAVEFFVGAQSGSGLRTVNVAARPFRTGWTDLESGRYDLMARATDNHGAKRDAIPIRFNVRPANDDFAHRFSFTGSFVTVTGALARATSEPGEPADLGPVNVWWSWTAPASAIFTITARAAPGYYPTLSVFTGNSLGGLTLVERSTSDGFDPAHPSRVVIAAQAGMVYAIAVGTVGYGDWCWLSVAQTAPPMVTLTSPTNNSSFVVGEVMTFEADAQDPDGTISRVEFVLNDYRLLGMATNSPFTLSLTLTNGSGHRVRAWATDDAGLVTGSDLIWLNVRYPGPPNDDFATRIAFTGSFVTVTGTTANATLEDGELRYLVQGSAWWAWTAPESGDFTLTVTSEPGYWPSMAVFTGSTLATLDLITNNAFHGDNQTYSTRVVLPAEAGTTYPIAVSSRANITLAVTKSLPPSVWITSPTNNSSFGDGDLVTFAAQAQDPDGNVRQVEFILDDYLLLGVATNSPFTLSLTFTNGSGHRVRAWATDDAGLVTLSDQVHFEVRYPGPPNDDFATRIAFTGSFVTVTGTTANATFEAGESSSVLHGSAWWAWTAPESGDFTLTVTSEPGYWPSMAVFTGSTLATLDLITNNTFQGDNQTYSTRVVLHAEAGTTYPIAVSSRANITLAVTKSLPPSVSITSPTNNSSFVVGDQVTFAAHAQDLDGTVRQVEFILDDYLLLGVATNSPFTLNLALTNGAWQHRVRAWATDDAGLVTGSDLIWFNLRYPGPPNDDFANRILLSGMFLLTPAYTYDATVEPGENTSPPGSAYGSVWWSWVAPASGKVTIACSRSAADMGVYIGSTLSNLTVIATNVANQSFPQLTFDALHGVEYQIALVSPRGFSDPAELALFQDARELHRPTLLPGGVFKFELVTPPGRTWIVEAGTNLMQWTPIATGHCADGVLEFLDPNAPFYPHRFYRFHVP